MVLRTAELPLLSVRPHAVHGTEFGMPLTASVKAPKTNIIKKKKRWRKNEAKQKKTEYIYI